MTRSTRLSVPADTESADLPAVQTERYELTWAGKRDAIRSLQAPGRGVLAACPDDSVTAEPDGWRPTLDSASPHLFIEGENLEVRKLLRDATITAGLFVDIEKSPQSVDPTMVQSSG